MLISGVALLIAILALYKSCKAHHAASDAITRQINNKLVTSFLERLNVEQLKRLEMGFRFKADTYQVSDILSGDFQLIDDYNALLNALNISDLKDYHAVIVHEISKRK
jgi:hypothetical protein|nr:MAG TPA: hypothetical protein [Caudoviricetes sp.]